MLKYILKRVGYAVLTLFALLTLTFFLMHLLPGKPFMGEKAISEVTRAALMEKYGLDKSVLEQFIMFIGNALKGDLGVSLINKRPIMTIIMEAFPYSFELGLRSLVLASCAGVYLGTIAAIRRGKKMDTLAMTISVIGVSVPSFIIAALLQYFLGLKFRQWFGITLFPISGWENEAAKILPTIALSLGSMATVSRLMRTSMLDVLGSDYIKTAKAKGLSERKIIWRHAMRNSLMPVITVLGPIAAAILTGAFVVEKIFSIPGMGKFFVIAITQQDYPLIVGTTIFYGAFLIVATLIVDILYGFIDPRVNLVGEKD
jgi:oligopeptide transport system permease protein